jgi:hypothetical protein
MDGVEKADKRHIAYNMLQMAEIRNMAEFR